MSVETITARQDLAVTRRSPSSYAISPQSFTVAGSSSAAEPRGPYLS
jgi:hypothetical protein